MVPQGEILFLQVPEIFSYKIYHLVLYLYICSGREKWQWQTSWFWQQLSMQKDLANSWKPLFSMTTVHFCVFPGENRICLGQTVEAHSARGGTARWGKCCCGKDSLERSVFQRCWAAQSHCTQVPWPLQFHFSPGGLTSAGSWASSSPPASRGLEGTS